MEIQMSYVDAVRNTRWMLDRASGGSTVCIGRPGDDRDVVMISGAEYRRLAAAAQEPTPDAQR